MMRACVLAALLATLAAPLAAQDWTASAGWIGLAGRRAAAFSEDVGIASGMMQGGELTVRRRWLGMSARAFGARFEPDSDSAAAGAGRITYGDVRVEIGPSILSADVGWGRRTLSGALATRNWSLVRIGVRSTFPIGGSGLSTQIALGWDPWVSGGDASGEDAETRVAYSLPTLPAYVVFGYRLERFTPRFGPDSRAEEVSSVVLGLGVAWPR